MPPAIAPAGWLVRETSGSARDLHDRPLPTSPLPEVWIHHVTQPALVLGSTQESKAVLVDSLSPIDDRSMAGPTEVCRRRSGGGLVALVPGNDLWIDVVLPAKSRLWLNDVGHAVDWLGRCWADAVASLLASAIQVEVHRGALRSRTAGSLVCFAGLGPGEVTVAGNKLVGISQRRTRTAARFQTVMTWSWPGRWLAAQLRESALAQAGLHRDTVVALDAGLPSSILASPRCPTLETAASAFLAHLPEP